MAITYTTLPTEERENIRYQRLVEIERSLYRRELDSLYLAAEVAAMSPGAKKTEAQARLAALEAEVVSMERRRDAIEAQAPSRR